MKKFVTVMAALVMLWGLPAQALSVTFQYAPSQAALTNPYIGSAAWANDDGERQQPFTLVYANLRWADFEPQEGVYDFETFEEENHFEKWRQEGKHLILRLVMDVPGSKKHMDIPQWLYDKTGDGKFYKVSYGRGYSPNYDNPVLIEAHARAVKALGQRYGEDPFLAYVEMGSLGHWGEWHVHKNAGRMPGEQVREEYALPYIASFPRAFLMMRRPFAFAQKNALGLYNDTAGEPQATSEWLTWIDQGGAYDQTGEENALLPMADGWRVAPIGGELSTSMKADQLLGAKNLSRTLDLFARSHTSWIGPGSFVKVKRDGKLQDALDQLNALIGYRLRVESATVSGGPRVSLTWVNEGTAPFYFDWQVCLRLVDESGGETRFPLEMRLSDVQPGAIYQADVLLHGLDDGSYQVDIGILDPVTSQPGVALAMEAPQKDGWYRLFQLKG